MKLQIYTDGSCLGNPGKGGYGVIILRKEMVVKYFSEGFKMTTNNRMELLACIMAFEYLRDNFGLEVEVEIFTDSNYVKKGITEWIKGWKSNGFKTKKRQPVKNADLWVRLDKLNVRLKSVVWSWVKAHNGNLLNEKVDNLARLAAEGGRFEG